MKIISKFYDCIDYLNDYKSDKVFVRNSSAYYIQSTYDHINKFNDRQYFYSEITDIKNTFLNKLDYFIKYENVNHLEIYGKFVFLPNCKYDIPVKINIYNIDENPQVKIESYYGKDQLVINDKLNHFINDKFIPELTVNTDNKIRNQPVWFLIFDNIVRNDNTNKEKSVWDYSWYHNNLDIYNIWVNFPLYRVEHLFKVKKEQIYQDLELYLWNDNTIDTMKNISNKDKIIQHGYDLKTSFRKEKE